MFGVVILLILLGCAFWWVRETRWALSGILIFIQLLIWWAAHDLDNGVPWNVDRPLFVGSNDPLWFTGVLILLMYGPLIAAGWVLWIKRR